jgi:hypothetical protein
MSKKQLPEGFDWKAFTPEDSPKTPMDVLADPQHQALATPDLNAGDMAYNFCSPLYDFSDGRENVTKEQFDLLSAAREKPVALIFGSYT